MKKPARLTLRQVEKTLRGKKLAAWKAATPAERAEVTAMLNEDAARRHAGGADIGGAGERDHDAKGVRG